MNTISILAVVTTDLAMLIALGFLISAVCFSIITLVTLTPIYDPSEFTMYWGFVKFSSFFNAVLIVFYLLNFITNSRYWQYTHPLLVVVLLGLTVSNNLISARKLRKAAGVKKTNFRKLLKHFFGKSDPEEQHE